ncbi:hypothetical protein [Flavobacterium cerinum]|uniref:Gliding motility-associated C-terminal domain-containing protein n=1 Tax=Flavobacterium cerinum TaxID=2502784 RepID=A0A444GMB1_9FLAO|nr:hypothetical protein [Flavobacterium cerinum]RWW92156.1 hypothetical protein EPI11_16145 [Flavobacterium cerinum]
MRKIKLQRCLNSLLLFITFYSFGQVTTTISDLKVSDMASTGITFNSNPTVTAKFDVNLLTYNGVPGNILGNIHVYIKKSASSEPSEVDWSPITFSVYYPPNTSSGTYTNRTPFTVELIKSAFFASGGVLYAEYKNNNGQKYKSAEILINGGAQSPPGPGILGTLDISGITYTGTGNLMSGDILYILDDLSTLDIKLKYSRTLLAGQSCSGVWILESVNNSAGLDRKHIGSVAGDSCMSDGSTTTGNFSVSLDKSFFNSGGVIRLEFVHTSADKHWRSQAIGVKIIKLTDNLIYNPNSRLTEIEVIIGQIGNISGIDATAQSGQEVLPVTYAWYSRSTSAGEWQLISGATSVNLAIPVSNSVEIIRRAYFKEVYSQSNVMKFIAVSPPLTPPDIGNTICCDQTVPNGAPVSLILGSTTHSARVLSYRWQSSRDSVMWTDITGSNQKNYTPEPLGPRSSGVYYRRVVETSLGASYSNYIRISSDSPGRD